MSTFAVELSKGTLLHPVELQHVLRPPPTVPLIGDITQHNFLCPLCAAGRRLNRRPINRRTWVQVHVLPFKNCGKFVHPTMTVSIGRYIKASVSSTWCQSQRRLQITHREMENKTSIYENQYGHRSLSRSGYRCYIRRHQPC